MSGFTPDVPPIPRPDPAELLGRFVPAALRRTPPVAKLWRMPRLVLLAVVTAGFYPCRALQVRLRQTLTMHARQCELASDLLAEHLPADDAATMTEAARPVATPATWLDTSVLLMLAALALLVYWVMRHDWDVAAVRQWWLHGPLPTDGVGVASVGLLFAAYLLLIVQMNRQLVAMQQYALAFNAVVGERLGEIDPPPLVWGLRPVHLLLGVAGACVGLIWALPMMLAWAAFTAFVRDSAYGFRVRLAERLTTLSGVDPVLPTADLCPNPDCHQSRPDDARFCPRCGIALSDTREEKR